MDERAAVDNLSLQIGNLGHLIGAIRSCLVDAPESKDAERALALVLIAEGLTETLKRGFDDHATAVYQAQRPIGSGQVEAGDAGNG